jgi:hypothetical protein
MAFLDAARRAIEVCEDQEVGDIPVRNVQNALLYTFFR